MDDMQSQYRALQKNASRGNNVEGHRYACAIGLFGNRFKAVEH